MCDITIGKTMDGKEVQLLSRMGCRHGLITGATGTGKTTTLRLLAEGFAHMGSQVIVTDIKGDVSGIVGALDNVHIYDVYGTCGTRFPIMLQDLRTDVISRLLDLTPAQYGAMHVLRKYAQCNGITIADIDDMMELLDYAISNVDEINEYGLVSKITLQGIQRGMLRLEEDGGASLFGYGGADMSQVSPRTMIFECERLYQTPVLYSTFLLYMLDKMFQLPECGDIDHPKAVIFFDEAHLLFRNTSKQVVERIEQTVKLIRSKGVGVYFISQNPKDIPDAVLAQLGNRIQHGLRAYTPNEWKGLKTAASSFRTNPKYNTMEEIQKLGIGEALVSCLDENGVPHVVEKVRIATPASGFGSLPEDMFSRYRDTELEEKIRNAKKGKAEVTESDGKRHWKTTWWGKTLDVLWIILKWILKIALVVLAAMLYASHNDKKRKINLKNY